MSIDTLHYAKKLEAAGIARPQAEAHAEALSHALSESVSPSLCLDARLAELKTDIFKAMVVQTIAIAGLLIAALKLLH